MTRVVKDGARLPRAEYKRRLLEMIDRVLSGEWSVERFWHEYTPFYALAEPHGDPLNECDDSFFAEVNEHLHYADWSSPADPDLTEPQEFIDWLAKSRDMYLAGQWKDPSPPRQGGGTV